MAKKSMVAREKKRERLVAKYAEKRAALKEIVNDESKLPEAGETAPQLQPCAPAQPLPADGSSARVLSQTENFADRAA